MEHIKVKLAGKQADGYIIPVGALNLVFVATDKGMVGCGAFDVAALEKFNFPAARVKASGGGRIATVEDLLSGVIKDTNDSAGKLGVMTGMTGKEALDLM
jgi:uncharacterized protein YunC (DUF1805 family)